MFTPNVFRELSREEVILLLATSIKRDGQDPVGTWLIKDELFDDATDAGIPGELAHQIAQTMAIMVANGIGFVSPMPE